jgi:hypothetical protein
MKVINIIKIGCAATLLCVFASCSDFLEIEPRNEIILEQFWNEKKDVDNIMAGCYSGLQTYDVISRMMAWGEFRSENVNTTGLAQQKDINLHRVLVDNLNASNSYTGWQGFYNVINRCNTVIYYAPSVAEKDPSYNESELRATIAEASALRDLCYFYLIRTFRDVPYTNEPYLDDDQVMDVPATPFNVVLDLLIEDLEKVQNDAVRRYPESNPEYQTGRITQDAIHAMLCEMYLWKNDYANCIRYADLVIEAYQKYAKEKEGRLLTDMQTRFNGFPLLRDNSTTSSFGDAFSRIFGEGNSSESIFELNYADDDNRISNLAVSTCYGNFAGNNYSFFVKPSDYVGLDQVNKMFAVFTNKYDARAYESLFPISTTSTTICKYVFRNPTIYFDQNASNASVNYTGSYADAKNHSNWIVYRLTDIMLLKAEALTQLMTDDINETNNALQERAFNLVSAVNKRSICKATLGDKDTLKMADFGTKDLMEELVMKERHRELLFEGKRWYDLVRRSLRDGHTQYLRAQIAQKGLENASIVNSKLARIDAIFWPYNIEEMKVNKNLVQNPAFGSGEDNSIENSATGK